MTIELKNGCYEIDGFLFAEDFFRAFTKSELGQPFMVANREKDGAITCRRICDLRALDTSDFLELMNNDEQAQAVKAFMRRWSSQ